MTDKGPFISLLVPVYNAERYLRECLDSLLSQDYTSMEVILIDDGSLDSSGDICDEYAASYPDEIKVIHQNNEGPLLARRKGFDIASGEYFMFVDSDDALFPEAVRTVAAAATETGADVIRWRATRESSDATNKYAKLTKIKYQMILRDEKSILLKKLCQSTSGSENAMWSKAVRRECAGARMDYSRFKGLTFAEDLLQTVVIYDQAETFCKLDATLYYYRPASGITSTYVPHMYTDVCCLDFAETFAQRWQQEYKCNDLLAGLAACRLDSAAQFAEYLASNNNSNALHVLRDSPDFQRCLRTPGHHKFLRPRRRIAIWALTHGAYGLLSLPMVIKRFARRQ